MPHISRAPLIEDDHALIPLTMGVFTTVDQKNIDLACHNWKALVCKSTNVTGYYAARTIKISDSRSASELLHRVILERELGRQLLGEEEVDHIDGNGLNNLLANLRLATRIDNARNIRKRPAHGDKPSTSVYKGVSYSRETVKKWRARIGHTLIGRYDTEEEAAKAYDVEASKSYGEFAKLNFPVSRLAGKVMRRI